MEKITLSFDDLVSTINHFGAELTSLRYKSNEYIWQADPAVWGRHAPILFPIVGKLRNNTYTFQGKPFSMGQHGFARDRMFSIVEQSCSSVKLLLRSDELSRAIYPFDFELIVAYYMQPFGMKVTYEVHNIQPSGSIFFSIGAHPGFIIPLEAGESLLDYNVNFHDSNLQHLDLYPLIGGYVNKDTRTLPIKNGILELKPELFEMDALIMDVNPTAKISIRSKKSGKGIGMSYADFRWLGIWTKDAASKFICIEPWNGIADTTDHDAQLEAKWGIIKLDAGEIYKVSYDVMVF